MDVVTSVVGEIVDIKVDRENTYKLFSHHVLLAGILIDQRSISSSDDDIETSFNGLTPYTNYTFTVRAENYGLVSESGATVVQQTDEASTVETIDNAYNLVKIIIVVLIRLRRLIMLIIW